MIEVLSCIYIGIMIVLLIFLIISIIIQKRHKLYAFLIPIVVVFSLCVYQVHSKYMIRITEKNVITAINTLQDSADNTPLFPEQVTKEFINALNEIMNNDIKASLDLMIALLSIVISVWGGITIYNLLKKDDFDKLNDDYKNSNTKSEHLFEQNIQLHKSYLLKNFDVNNNSSQYFYALFKDMDFNTIDFNGIDYRFLMNATFIETIYTKITALHKSNEHRKMPELLDEGFRKCEELVKIIDEMEPSYKERNHLYGYVHYRWARMHFYTAMMTYYCEQNYEESYNSFEKSILEFNKALGCDPAISETINVYNTIGYIYIRMYEFISKYIVTMHVTQSKLNELKEQAYINCERANQNPYNGLIIKNLGIAYENKGDLDSAIEQYRLSIYKDPTEPTTRVCLASAYLKKAKEILKITETRDKLLFEYTFDDDQKKDAKVYLDMASEQLQILHELDSKIVNYYYKMGEMYTYKYLLENNSKSKKIYINIAKKNLNMAETLNPKFIAHRFHTRNFYEAVGKIYDAKSINDKLQRNDTKKLNALYGNYLN